MKVISMNDRKVDFVNVARDLLGMDRQLMANVTLVRSLLQTHLLHSLHR